MALPDGDILAAVDIGSNSIHLIVARVVQGSLQTISSHRERVQLALGMGADSLLTGEAMQRGYDCLQRMGAIIRDANPDKLRVVGTFALREARNRDTFIQRAEELLGCPLEIISGREEARLIFVGLAHSRQLDQESLVIDIGGGSTELACGSGFEPGFRASCRMGCVSFSEQFFSAGLDGPAFARAHRAALQAMEKYLAQLERIQWHQVFVTSGSAKALAQAATNWKAQPGEFSLQHMLQLRAEVIARNDVNWLTELGIADNRINLIPGGLAIMLAAMQCLRIDHVTYQDVALREGVLYEMIEQMRHPDIRLRSRQSLQSRYNVDVAHAERVATTLQQLMGQLPQGWFGYDSEAREILLEAAHLHEVGLQISANGLQKHSAYIVDNSDLPGYNQDRQKLLAALVRQHRKRIRAEDIPTLRGLGKPGYLRLLGLLRLAVVLNVTRWPVDMEAITLAPLEQGEGLRLRMPEGWLDQQILLGADLEREAGYLAEHGLELAT